jgi:hypothetical protein
LNASLLANQRFGSVYAVNLIRFPQRPQTIPDFPRVKF